LLVVVPAIRFSDPIFAQTHSQIIAPDGHRVSERLNAAGIDRFHLLDQGEDVVQLGQRIGGLLFGKIELCQFGESIDVGKGQRHEEASRVARDKSSKMTISAVGKQYRVARIACACSEHRLVAVSISTNRVDENGFRVMASFRRRKLRKYRRFRVSDS
jgi:hypothetical protein